MLSERDLAIQELFSDMEFIEDELNSIKGYIVHLEDCMSNLKTDASKIFTDM